MIGLSQLSLLFLAGGLGTLSRFGLSTLLSCCFTRPEPWGTAVINILGCFFFGMIAEAFQIRETWSLQARVIILTGFFGAFTTFSTYMFEIHSLLTRGSAVCACAGFLLQNGLGFSGIILGIVFIRHFFS